MEMRQMEQEKNQQSDLSGKQKNWLEKKEVS
jgi:hypothetical protein